MEGRGEELGERVERKEGRKREGRGKRGAGKGEASKMRGNSVE